MFNDKNKSEKRVNFDKKIEKGKAYTYEEIKEIFDTATAKTLANPEGNAKEKILDPDAKYMLLLSGTVICLTLQDNFFEGDDKDE